MCLAVLALGQHPRYAVVLASNRDEYHSRPTAPLARWHPEGARQPVYSGRDLLAGGTWIGLGADHRVALLTNVRRPWPQHPGAPSRGQLPLDWLGAPAMHGAADFWSRHAGLGHSPFNLLAGDGPQGDWFWGSNVRAGQPGWSAQSLKLPCAGLFGLCNAALETPWPKLLRLKQQVGDALASPLADDPQQLAALLWQALADRHQPPDDQLPDTGVGPQIERLLAPIFIRDERGLYGTRASTLLLIERGENGAAGPAHLLERRFGPAGELLGQTDFWALPAAAG